MKTSYGFFTLFLILLLSCGGTGTHEDRATAPAKMAMDDAEIAPATRQEAPQDAPPPQPTERKLIKTGNIRFETDDIDASYQQIKAKLKEYSGFISDEELSSYYDRREKRLTARIPSQHFDSFLEYVTTVAGYVESQRVHVNDVTQQYIDIKIRLENKQELLRSYQELLKQAKTITEVLEIERELNAVRSDIESFEGQLRYYDNQVELGTLEISFYTYKHANTRFGAKLGKALSTGWDNFLGFIVGFTRGWPFWILFGLIIWLLARWLKKRRQRKQTPR